LGHEAGREVSSRVSGGQNPVRLLRRLPDSGIGLPGDPAADRTFRSRRQYNILRHPGDPSGDGPEGRDGSGDSE